MFNANVQMTQQEISAGLEDLTPSQAGKYLFTILVNAEAKVHDVAQVALQTTFASTNIADASLVLPVIFHLRIESGCEGLYADFQQAVNTSLGLEHSRCVIDIHSFAGYFKLPVNTIIEEQLAARKGLDEKLHFLANAIITNRLPGGGSTNHYLGTMVITGALQSKLVRWEGEENLVTSLRVLLEEITGSDRDVMTEFTDDLNVIREAQRGAEAPQAAPATAAPAAPPVAQGLNSDWCTLS